MTERESLWEYASCTGGAECPSHVHVHGCFRDEGTCDRHSDHDPAEKMLRLQGFLDSRGICADGEPDDGDGYEWCWIACPHDPPCAVAPPSSDPRDE